MQKLFKIADSRWIIRTPIITAPVLARAVNRQPRFRPDMTRTAVPHTNTHRPNKLCRCFSMFYLVLKIHRGLVPQGVYIIGANSSSNPIPPTRGDRINLTKGNEGPRGGRAPPRTPLGIGTFNFP